MGVCSYCPVLQGTPYYLSNGQRYELQFCMHIYKLDRNKNPLKILGKVAMGLDRESPNIFRAHRAVILGWAFLKDLHSTVAVKDIVMSASDVTLFSNTQPNTGKILSTA